APHWHSLGFLPDRVAGPDGFPDGSAGQGKTGASRLEGETGRQLAAVSAGLLDVSTGDGTLCHRQLEQRLPAPAHPRQWGLARNDDSGICSIQSGCGADLVPGGLALRSLRTAQRAVGVLRDLCARLSRLCDHLDVCGGGCNVRTLRPVPGHFPCGGQGICLGLRTGAAACERNRLVQHRPWLAATRGERGCWGAVGSYRTSPSLFLRR